MLLLVLNTDFMLVLNMLWFNHSTELLKTMKCICLLLNFFVKWGKRGWNTRVIFCKTNACPFLSLLFCSQAGSWSLRSRRVDSVLETWAKNTALIPLQAPSVVAAPGRAVLAQKVVSSAQTMKLKKLIEKWKYRIWFMQGKSMNP